MKKCYLLFLIILSNFAAKAQPQTLTLKGHLTNWYGGFHDETINYAIKEGAVNVTVNLQYVRTQAASVYYQLTSYDVSVEKLMVSWMYKRDSKFSCNQMEGVADLTKAGIPIELEKVVGVYHHDFFTKSLKLENGALIEFYGDLSKTTSLNNAVIQGNPKWLNASAFRTYIENLGITAVKECMDKEDKAKANAEAKKKEQESTKPKQTNSDPFASTSSNTSVNKRSNNKNSSDPFAAISPGTNTANNNNTNNNDPFASISTTTTNKQNTPHTTSSPYPQELIENVLLPDYVTGSVINDERDGGAGEIAKYKIVMGDNRRLNVYEYSMPEYSHRNYYTLNSMPIDSIYDIDLIPNSLDISYKGGGYAGGSYSNVQSEVDLKLKPIRGNTAALFITDNPQLAQKLEAGFQKIIDYNKAHTLNNK